MNRVTSIKCYYKEKVGHILWLVKGSFGYRRESVREKQYGGFKTGPADLFAQVSHTSPLASHTALSFLIF